LIAGVRRVVFFDRQFDHRREQAVSRVAVVAIAGW
jgi:hypothetical protein